MRTKFLKFCKNNCFFAIVIVIAILFNCYIGRLSWVIGESMEPTYQEGNLLYLSVLAKENIKRNDVIVFKPSSDIRHLVKRVIGLPGDHIQIKDGRVYINGELFEDDIITYAAKEDGDYNDIELKEDEYYVLGDNRNNSCDSRWFGPVKTEEITGVAKKSLIPLKDIQ